MLISNGNSYSPVFASNNNNISFEATQLYALNSQNAVLSARLNSLSNDVGRELFKFNLTSSGLIAIDTKEIMVYPNPSNDFINIQLNSKINKVEVYDLNGCLVLVGDGAEINIQTLNKGMYILKAETGDGVYNARFVRK